MDVYEIITDRIIEKLEAGTIPWHKPWSGGDGIPKNLITKKEYRGINVFMLGVSGWGSSYWLSYKQAQELGGCVKKGEKGTPVVFWKWLTSKKEDESDEKNFPMLRYYTVFNVEQTEGIDEKKIPSLAIKYNKIERLEQCEAITANMPKKPMLTFNEQRAYYSPTLDYVNMPKRKTFTSSEEYYSTLFHELTHSTGHASRVNRKGIDCPDGSWSSFGSVPYAKEELVAEMGASFLCGICQVENKTIDNSAAYIKSWLRKLKDDKKMVIMAAAQAQKAVDFILGKPAMV